MNLAFSLVTSISDLVDMSQLPVQSKIKGAVMR